MESNQRFCKQKQDIFKEAAHEIKSPIAILKARLSLFKQNEDSDKAAFIQESEDDIRTISNKLHDDAGGLQTYIGKERADDGLELGRGFYPLRPQRGDAEGDAGCL